MKLKMYFCLGILIARMVHPEDLHCPNPRKKVAGVSQNVRDKSLRLLILGRPTQYKNGFMGSGHHKIKRKDSERPVHDFLFHVFPLSSF